MDSYCVYTTQVVRFSDSLLEMLILRESFDNFTRVTKMMFKQATNVFI